MKPSESLLKCFIACIIMSGIFLGTSQAAFNPDEWDSVNYVYDNNGNVTELLDGNTGEIIGKYEYDPYGNTTKIEGEAAKENKIRFSTKELDETTGLYYYGYRHYDPKAGRWPSRDPIEEMGGVNLYGMLGNNAVGRWDELGLSSLGSTTDTKATLVLHSHATITDVRKAIKSNWFASTRTSENLNYPKVVKSGKKNGLCCATLKDAGSTEMTVTTHIPTSNKGFSHSVTNRAINEILQHEQRRQKVGVHGLDIYQTVHDHYTKNIGKEVCRKNYNDAINAIITWIGINWKLASVEYVNYDSTENAKVTAEIWQPSISPIGNTGRIRYIQHDYYSKVAKIKPWKNNSPQYSAFPK